jgi:acyl carrier protein
MAPDRDAVMAELDSLLREVWREHPEGEIDSAATLRDLGVQSSILLTFLVRIEERFKFKWDPDLAAGALSRMDSIADTVLEQLRRGQELAEVDGER